MSFDISAMNRRVLGLVVAAALSVVQERPVSAYKILMIPLPGRSHLFSMTAVAKGLVSRGHRVSLLVGEHFPTDGLTEVGGQSSSISVIRHSDTDEDGVTTDPGAMMENVLMNAIVQRLDKWNLIPFVKYNRDYWCNNVIRNDELMARLESQEFDMAVVDADFIVKCFLLVPHRLRIPWVTYTDAPVNPLVTQRAPWLSSFVQQLDLPLSGRMSFVDRLKNTLMLAASFVNPPFPDPPSHLLDEYRRYGSFRDLDDLMSRSQLWLLTKHIVLDDARPVMPHTVDVGGLTVGRTSGELPEEMKRFVEGAEHGVILMTFGSTLSTLPATVVQKFASAFLRLDGYRVVWRLINRDNVELPDNVMIGRWLPQNDLLAHPSVKLFIAHGGNNGQFEAIYHAVPVISFPVFDFGDQVRNARRIAQKGYGLSMDLHDFTADQLVANTRKILEDRSYKQRVTKASKIFRSEAQSPVEKAAYWIEHACQFGSSHLRSADANLSTLDSYLLLDLLAVTICTLIVVLCLLVKLTTIVKRKLSATQRSIPTKRVKYD